MFTKRMIQTMMVIVALFGTFATTPKASADFFLTSADIQINNPVGALVFGPPIVDQNNIQAPNRTYTNTYGVNANGQLTIRTITAGVLDSVFPDFVNPVSGPGSEPTLVTFIAVLDGVISADGTQVTYDTGRAGAFAANQRGQGAPTFVPNDPSTWGFNASFAPGVDDDSGAFAEWTLGPQVNISVDNPFGLPLLDPVSGATVNTSSVDSSTPTLLTEGRFLFIEDSVDGQDPADGFIEILNNLNYNANDDSAPGYVDVAPADGLNDNGTPASDPNTNFVAADVQAEGIFIDSADTIEDSAFDEGSNIPAGADLALLNAIGIWGTVNDDNANGIEVDGVDGSGVGFASTFGGAGLADYTPIFGQNATGDFTASGDIDIRPGVLSNIPEPTTALLGLMGLAGMGLRRRRNA